MTSMTLNGTRHATRPRTGIAGAEPIPDEDGCTDMEALLLQRATDLVPALRERASLAEEQRRVPEETIQDFHDAGLFRVLQPRRVGGSELHPRAFFDIAAQIAHGCASSAWVLSNLAIHHQFMALWPQAAQDEVWGPSPDTLIGSSYIFARGKARKESGGYVLSGHWPFSSGIDHCEWCVLGANTVDESDPSRVHQRYFLVPRADYAVLDTWRVVGLRATGSNDVRMAEVFVPEYRTVAMDEVIRGEAPGLAVNPGALFRLTMQGTGGFVLLPTLYGAARAAANDYVDGARSRTTTVGAKSQAELPAVQDRVANVEACLDTALMIGHRGWNEAMQRLQTHSIIDGETGARLRRDSAFAARLIVQAMDQVFAGCGGAGLYESSAMQRMWRDVHAGAAQFGLQWDVSGPAYGRVRLGLPSGIAGLGA